jgi:hypothetical protein
MTLFKVSKFPLPTPFATPPPPQGTHSQDTTTPGHQGQVTMGASID